MIDEPMYAPVLGMDAATRGRVNALALQIRDRMKRSAEDIISIGNMLTEVKEAMPHGQFGPWLDREFGWDHRTARNFMQVADRFGGLENGKIFRFAPSALYALSSGDVSDEIREEFIERAESGERITHAMVKDALRPEQPVIEMLPIVDIEDDPILVDTSTGEILDMAPVVVPEPLRVRLEDWADRHAPKPVSRELELARNFNALAAQILKVDPDALAEAAADDRALLELTLRPVPALVEWLDRFTTAANDRMVQKFRVVR